MTDAAVTVALFIETPVADEPVVPAVPVKVPDPVGLVYAWVWVVLATFVTLKVSVSVEESYVTELRTEVLPEAPAVEADSVPTPTLPEGVKL